MGRRKIAIISLTAEPYLEGWGAQGEANLSETHFCKVKKKNSPNLFFSVALVRTRTIPTERPPPVGEVSANFSDRGVSRGQRNGSPQPLISVF